MPLAVDTRKAVASCLPGGDRPAASRESIAALLWPESDGADARGALRRTLRCSTAPSVVAAWRSIGSGGARCREVDIDLRAFRGLLGRAREHDHDLSMACEACDALLDEALALDRGPFLDGFSLRDSEPSTNGRPRGQRLPPGHAAALERLARSKLAARHWDRAVLVGRRWLDLDPLHEPAHRLLMSAFAAAARMRRQFANTATRRVLEAELGVGPLKETTDLYEAIRTGSCRPPATARTARPTHGATARPARGEVGARPAPGKGLWSDGPGPGGTT